MDRRMWYGEWPVETPKPSPGPWTVRRAMVHGPAGRGVEWVVMDRDNRSVACCDKQVDAEFIAAHGPEMNKETT